jgi:signal transduction histidine kinase
MHNMAHHGFNPEAQEVLIRAFPIGPTRKSMSGRAILDCAVVQSEDTSTDDEATISQQLSRLMGFRGQVSVPMLRDGVPVGAITVARRERGPFPERQVALLQTFADQAVIAIENVRLFKELQTSNRDLTTALDKQTATSDILRVISQSQTNIQPVFDAIVTSAVRLLAGYTGALTLTRDQQIELAVLTSTDDTGDAAVRATFPKSLQSVGAHPRAIRDRAPLNVADAHTDARLADGERTFAAVRGFRSWVVVPMLRDDRTIGAIGVTRREAGGFTDDEIALLKTFADQAVIAIENVRLFTELQERNREVEQKSGELAAASQHKSEFLANMSHELRTPLNAIIGFSEVLTERMFGELNEKQEEYLKDIYASGTHLLSLINDILDLSKIEAGRMELELTDFHLPTALDNALMLVRERAGRRSITFHTALDARLGQVRADERKIRQVVLNLLSNAIKFTPEGGRIEVAAVPKDGSVEVSVSDTGIGIAPEDQEAVFEEFRQVGTSEKKAEGTGLGLTLCRKFIELHGGRIWVKSQLGAGSTFTFTMPVRYGK